jgi:putative transposase
LRRWISRARSGQSLVPKPHGGGRKPLLDAADMTSLEVTMTGQPHVTVEELQAHLKASGKSVAIPTLRRALKRSGIRRHRPQASGAVPEATTKQYGYQSHHRRPSTRRGYPSSLTDAEWGLVRDLFETSGGPGRPGDYSRRELLDAICYVVRAGCAWRMLPKGFPTWQNVYATFRRWVSKGLFERMHDRLRAQWRAREERDANPTAAVIDSQSVKTAEKGGPTGTTGARRSTAASATS